MSRTFAKDPSINNALRHSVRDGVAYSVMAGAGETYFSAFALFFKASTTQIGLLASLPPLVSSAAQLFSAWLSHTVLTRRQVILTGASIQAMIWLPLLLLPLLFHKQAVPLIILCIVLYHAMGNVIIPHWSSLMGDLVPERRRGRYFARRTRYTSISAFMALILAGIILDTFRRHDLAIYGFITVFAIAALARCISVYHLTWLVEYQKEPVVIGPSLEGGWWQRAKQSRFFHFSVFFAMMQTAVAIGSPFFAVFMLRDLHFTYVQFMVLSASTVLMQFLTLNTWGRISDRFGNRLILFTTGFVIPIIPALWLVSNNFFYLIGVQLTSGLLWAGFSLSAGNFLYDLIAPPRRATYLALHNVLTNIGIFCGALLGGYLGAHMPKTFSLLGVSHTLHSPLLWVFLLSCLTRLSVALIFLPRLKEVRNVKPMTVSQLIFRATRFSAMSGLIYDVIGTARKRESVKTENN